MNIHLPWIRVTAAAVLVAGIGVHEAAAQFVPYRPSPQQPATSVAATSAAAGSAAVAPAATAPQQAQTMAPAAATQTPYTTAYTAYRTLPAAPTSPYPSTAQSYSTYGSPTGAQYAQPTAAYSQYPQTGSQYPANYNIYPYVAQQPTPDTLPAPKQTNVPTTQPSPNAPTVAAPAGGMPAGNMNGAQTGACGCNAATYGAGEYYTAPGCGCGPTGGYPNCNINNYFGEESCSENQWFAGVYFLEMGRTNATSVKLTSQIPTGTAYPYYPTANDTILTSRDVDFNFREGVEVRVGSTFTIGDSCNACQSPCGYNTGCGCNSCGPQTTYAWEVAWWGINDSPDTQTVVYTTNRLVGMKNYAGLQYNGGPVNNYYGYGVPVLAFDPTVNDNQILAQRVRTNFNAQNLELNFIRFPMCNTGCSTGGCGCNGGCGGYDACGCNGCDDNCGLGFSMYGSCGVRWFRVDDDFLYGTEFNPNFTGTAGTGDHPNYDGFGTGVGTYELYHDIQVENNLVGPQVGWTSDYCWGKWNLFINSTFGIFDNHMSVWQRMYDGAGTSATFAGDGSTYNVRTHKDAVAFLGELRVGTAYDITCNWRAVIAYRAVAITGLATASDQLQNDYSNRYDAGIIDSDNSVIIHGAQVGAECRY